MSILKGHFSGHRGVLGFPTLTMTEADSSHTLLGALQNKVSGTNPRNHGPAGKLETTFITSFAKMTARQESSWLNYGRMKRREWDCVHLGYLGAD